MASPSPLPLVCVSAAHDDTAEGLVGCVSSKRMKLGKCCELYSDGKDLRRFFEELEDRPRRPTGLVEGALFFMFIVFVPKLGHMLRIQR